MENGIWWSLCVLTDVAEVMDMGKVTPFIMKLKHKSGIINMQTHIHIFWFLSLDFVRKFSSTFTVLFIL